MAPRKSAETTIGSPCASYCRQNQSRKDLPKLGARSYRVTRGHDGRYRNTTLRPWDNDNSKLAAPLVGKSKRRVYGDLRSFGPALRSPLRRSTRTKPSHISSL